MKNSNIIDNETKALGKVPCPNIGKLGIVTRDYGQKYPNGYRDFSNSLDGVLKLLDERGCDAVLFSLFSIDTGTSFDPYSIFVGLHNIKAVFLEKFLDGEKREAKYYVVYHRSANQWDEYTFVQRFGSINDKQLKEYGGIARFVGDELPKRMMGNCCVLLCGETNGVKYSPSDHQVHDCFDLRSSIPDRTNIILNPIHDRMTRFEMKEKRQFLSENGRWVVSAWNKGKKDKNGKIKDGKGPAWTVFHNGERLDAITNIPNSFDVEIGILDLTSQ